MTGMRVSRRAVWVVSAAITAAAAIAAIGNTASVATSSYPGGQLPADPHSDPAGPCYWEEQTQHRVKDGVRYSCRLSGTAERGPGWVDDEGRQ